MDIHYFEIAGVKRPVVFSMRAVKNIQDAFGGMEKMSEGVIDRDIGIVNKVLEILLDAGQAYCEGVGVDCPPPLKCSPADIMDIGETQAAVEMIFEVIKADGERSVEVSSKN